MDDKIKVLIVEDEALIGVSLEKVLSKMGYQPLGVARTGEEAISMAFLENPDVILMDIRIKGNMDGIEASERINSEKSIPVIFLTAYNDDQYIDRCVKTGSYGFLSKPASSQEIKAAIEIAVNRHRALKAEEGMRKKESVLKAVGFAAEQFLKSFSFEEGIKETISNIGKLTGFERVCLFKNQNDSQGNICMSIFYFWDSEPEKSVPPFEECLPYSKMPLCFEETMRKGDTFFVNLEDLNLPNMNYLKSRGLHSLFFVPVSVGDDWWGFICFERSRKSENWSEGEKEGLSAAATFIGSAILNESLNAEIKNSEKRYRSLVDNSPIGIEIFQDEKVVYTSPVLAEMLSMSLDDIKNKPFSDLIHPDDIGFVLEMNRKRLAGSDDVLNNYKLRVIDGKGDIKTIDVNVALIEWNMRPATINFLIDITEKEKAVLALKESEERYRGVVENARINILITQDEKICYANPCISEFLGISNEALVSRYFSDFIHKDDRDNVLKNHNTRLNSLKNHQIPEKYTIRAYNSVGEVRTLDFNTTVIRWKGKPATLNFLVDITDQIESTRLLKKALSEKTILLQEVHHRVKNNLALINSLLSMQARTARTDDVLNSLRDAETRIFSIAAVHEGLYKSSSISTIPAGEHFLSLGDEIISNYAPDAGIKLDVSAHECCLGLDVAIPVSLVVNELLTNSIKYAFVGREKGRIYIEMDCKNDYITLVVGDDGVGIAKDFDFSKIESLGMTLVRNIIEKQLEGTITLERDHGTRWVITLSHL